MHTLIRNTVLMTFMMLFALTGCMGQKRSSGGQNKSQTAGEDSACGEAGAGQTECSCSPCEDGATVMAYVKGVQMNPIPVGVCDSNSVTFDNIPSANTPFTIVCVGGDQTADEAPVLWADHVFSTNKDANKGKSKNDTDWSGKKEDPCPPGQHYDSGSGKCMDDNACVCPGGVACLEDGTCPETKPEADQPIYLLKMYPTYTINPALFTWLLQPEIEVKHRSDVRNGLVQVDLKSVPLSKEVYLYSNAFNRYIMDGSGPKPGEINPKVCDTIDIGNGAPVRHLFELANDKPINPGTAADKDWGVLRHGVMCDNAANDPAKACEGLPNPAPGLYCRIDLVKDGKYLYQNASALKSISAISRVKDAQFVMVMKDADGKVTKMDKTVSLEKPVLFNDSVSWDSNTETVTVDFDYEHASADQLPYVTVAGLPCESKDLPAASEQKIGSGHMKASCNINSMSSVISLNVPGAYSEGIGTIVDHHDWLLEFGAPQISISKGDLQPAKECSPTPNSNCWGTLNLHWSAEFPWTLKNITGGGDAVTGTIKTLKFIKGLQLGTYNPSVAFQYDYAEADKTKQDLNVSVDHNHYRWRIVVTDLQGWTYLSDEVRYDYPTLDNGAYFNVAYVDQTVDCKDHTEDYDCKCRSVFGYPYCETCQHLYLDGIKGEFVVTATHLKSLSWTCSDAGPTSGKLIDKQTGAYANVPAEGTPASYKPQTYQFAFDSNSAKSTQNCTFTVTNYLGQTYQVPTTSLICTSEDYVNTY